MAMCACANGDWMHPPLMFLFKNSIQSCADFIENGPRNAIEQRSRVI